MEAMEVEDEDEEEQEDLTIPACLDSLKRCFFPHVGGNAAVQKTIFEVEEILWVIFHIYIHICIYIYIRIIVRVKIS